jgi:hydroxyacylglutathione hydrolase
MQQVCLNCGYNIVGYEPDFCPFCGAPKNQFITAEECTSRYKIKEIKVNNKVSGFNSYPRLGLEHAAYRIKTNHGFIMIDCPSTFRTEIKPIDCILFTHHHFLGASNLYKRYFGTNLWINSADSNNSLTKNYEFDSRFNSNFEKWDIHAYHIDGHTRGFTFYIFDDVLFICDYIFVNSESLRFNPYGPYQRTVKGANKMMDIVSDVELTYVCGFDYTMDFSKWIKMFKELVSHS